MTEKYKWVEKTHLFKEMDEPLEEVHKNINKDLTPSLPFNLTNIKNIIDLIKICKYWCTITEEHYKYSEEIFNECTIPLLKKEILEVVDSEKELYQYFLEFLNHKNKIFFAIRKNSIECLKNEFSKPLNLKNKRITFIAGKYNKTNFLKILHEKGFILNKNICNVTKNLEIMKYCNENGCEINEDTLIHVSKINNFELFKYVYDIILNKVNIENTILYKENIKNIYIILNNIFKICNINIIKLIDIKYIIFIPYHIAFESSCLNDNIELFIYLYTNLKPIAYSIIFIGKYGRLKFLKFMSVVFSP